LGEYGATYLDMGSQENPVLLFLHGFLGESSLWCALMGTITFNIPEGYEVKNLDDLKINFTYDREGETILAFVSDYTLEGNTVKIVIDEYYKENHFPVEEYEAFRSTINGAADFNKVTLVMVEK
ncbi:MAG: hypothetical protein AAF193_08580, partial [Bacteroidota bacterium]